MKLVKNSSYVKVCSFYDCDGYSNNMEYLFNTLEDVLSFLNGSPVEDVYGRIRTKSYYEQINSISLKTDYDIDYE